MYRSKKTDAFEHIAQLQHRNRLLRERDRENLDPEEIRKRELEAGFITHMQGANARPGRRNISASTTTPRSKSTVSTAQSSQKKKSVTEITIDNPSPYGMRSNSSVTVALDGARKILPGNRTESTTFSVGNRWSEHLDTSVYLATAKGGKIPVRAPNLDNSDLPVPIPRGQEVGNLSGQSVLIHTGEPSPPQFKVQHSPSSVSSTHQDRTSHRSNIAQNNTEKRSPLYMYEPRKPISTKKQGIRVTGRKQQSSQLINGASPPNALRSISGAIGATSASPPLRPTRSLPSVSNQYRGLASSESNGSPEQELRTASHLVAHDRISPPFASPTGIFPAPSSIPSVPFAAQQEPRHLPMQQNASPYSPATAHATQTSHQPLDAASVPVPTTNEFLSPAPPSRFCAPLSSRSQSTREAQQQTPSEVGMHSPSVNSPAWLNDLYHLRDNLREECIRTEQARNTSSPLVRVSRKLHFASPSSNVAHRDVQDTQAVDAHPSSHTSTISPSKIPRSMSNPPIATHTPPKRIIHPRSQHQPPTSSPPMSSAPDRAPSSHSSTTTEIVSAEEKRLTQVAVDCSIESIPPPFPPLHSDITASFELFPATPGESEGPPAVLDARIRGRASSPVQLNISRVSESNIQLQRDHPVPRSPVVADVSHAHQISRLSQDSYLWNDTFDTIAGNLGIRSMKPLFSPPPPLPRVPANNPTTSNNRQHSDAPTRRPLVPSHTTSPLLLPKDLQSAPLADLSPSSPPPAPSISPPPSSSPRVSSELHALLSSPGLAFPINKSPIQALSALPPLVQQLPPPAVISSPTLRSPTLASPPPLPSSLSSLITRRKSIPFKNSTESGTSSTPHSPKNALSAGQSSTPSVQQKNVVTQQGFSSSPSIHEPSHPHTDARALPSHISGPSDAGRGAVRARHKAALLLSEAYSPIAQTADNSTPATAAVSTSPPVPGEARIPMPTHRPTPHALPMENRSSPEAYNFSLDSTVLGTNQSSPKHSSAPLAGGYQSPTRSTSMLGPSSLETTTSPRTQSPSIRSRTGASVDLHDSLNASLALRDLFPDYSLREDIASDNMEDQNLDGTEIDTASLDTSRIGALDEPLITSHSPSSFRAKPGYYSVLRIQGPVPDARDTDTLDSISQSLQEQHLGLLTPSDNSIVLDPLSSSMCQLTSAIQSRLPICRFITLLPQAIWNENSADSFGLQGLQILVRRHGKIVEFPLEPSHFSLTDDSHTFLPSSHPHAMPAHLRAPLDSLGVLCHPSLSCHPFDTWRCPWTMISNSGQKKKLFPKLRIDLGKPLEIAGLRVYNCNANPEFVATGGIRLLRLELDNIPALMPIERPHEIQHAHGSPASVVIRNEFSVSVHIRPGSGEDWWDFGQHILFAEEENRLIVKQPQGNRFPALFPLPLAPLPSYFPSQHKIIAALKQQDFQPSSGPLPCGSSFRFVFPSNFGDPHYIGIDALALYDARGVRVPVFPWQIHAYPCCTNAEPLASRNSTSQYHTHARDARKHRHWDSRIVENLCYIPLSSHSFASPAQSSNSEQFWRKDDPLLYIGNNVLGRSDYPHSSTSAQRSSASDVPLFALQTHQQRLVPVTEFPPGRAWLTTFPTQTQDADAYTSGDGAPMARQSTPLQCPCGMKHTPNLDVQGPLPLHPTIVISLDSPVSISSIRIWNNSKQPVRGASAVQVWVDGTPIAQSRLAAARNFSYEGNAHPVEHGRCPSSSTNRELPLLPIGSVRPCVTLAFSQDPRLVWNDMYAGFLMGTAPEWPVYQAYWKGHKRFQSTQGFTRSDTDVSFEIPMLSQKTWHPAQEEVDLILVNEGRLMAPLTKSAKMVYEAAVKAAQTGVRPKTAIERRDPWPSKEQFHY